MTFIEWILGIHGTGWRKKATLEEQAGTWKLARTSLQDPQAWSPCRNTLIQMLTLWWRSSPPVWQLMFKVQEENFWGACSVIVPEQECNIIALASTVGCGSHLTGCYTRIPKDRDWHYLLRVWDWTIKKQHMFITQIYLFCPSDTHSWHTSLFIYVFIQLLVVRWWLTMMYVNLIKCLSQLLVREDSLFYLLFTHIFEIFCN